MHCVNSHFRQHPKQYNYTICHHLLSIILSDFLNPKNIFVWGEIGGYECELTKRGDKYRVNFSLSDYTNAINVKMLVDKDKISRISSVFNGNIIMQLLLRDTEDGRILNKQLDDQKSLSMLKGN